VVIKLHTKEAYAVVALLMLAAHRGRVLPTKAIARRSRFSERFLAYVMGLLKHAGIIESVRGKQGGYKLARPAYQIRLDQVIEAVGVAMETAPPQAATAEEALLAELQKEIGMAMKNTLSGIHFQGLEERIARLSARQTLTFHI